MKGYLPSLVRYLEDKFVAKEWIPPFLELSPTPPPKQKRKDNSEQQKRKMTKMPEKKKSNDNNITSHLIT